MALRPGVLGDAIDNPKDKTKDLVEPAAGKQGAVAAIVHQRKAARRKKNEQDQDRQQQQALRQRAGQYLGHRPPKQGHRDQGADHLQKGAAVIALAIGLKLKITAAQRPSRRPRRLKVGGGQELGPRGQAIQPLAAGNPNGA